MPKPPPRLWVRGELPRGPCVAIVGTRHPTRAGARFAEELACTLAREGVTIASGGAKGIDSAAHRGALRGKGPTVVVSPSGFGAEYPKRNVALFDEVVEKGGAILTSFPPGARAMHFRFFLRNAQLAALSDALVVVQSDFQGGARNAAHAARKLGRPVFAVPGAPWVRKSRGCLLEIRNGATLLLGVEDIRAVLRLPKPRTREGVPPGRSGGRTPARPDDPLRERVVSALARGPLHPDGLCVEAAVPPAELQALLLTLTLEGIVVSDPSGRVLLVNARID